MLNPEISLWKNNRIINKQHNLIVPEDRERLFQNAECVALLENILSIYQHKGQLPAHYLHYSMNPGPENETITYKAYVNYRCTKRDRKEGKQRVVGEFYIIYRIIRLRKEATNCQFPFLILFDAKGGEVVCDQCKQAHIHRITESNFYVVRIQFAYELKSKLKFMGKYANYEFTPQNFFCNKPVGDTPFEHVRDHNYEPSYYFQRCQRMFVDSLKLAMLRRSIDCESMRLDQLELESQLAYHSHTALFKLKYMCRKCEGKEIWTTRDKVIIKFCILPLEKYFDMMVEKLEKKQRKQIYDESDKLKNQYESKRIVYTKKEADKEKEDEEGQDKRNIQTIFKTEKRRLDRSIKRQVDEHEQFEKDFQKVNRWHLNLEAYSYPFLILYSIKVPKMACIRCKKEKDGLIYITNLVDQTHSTLNRKVINTMLNMMKKKESS